MNWLHRRRALADAEPTVYMGRSYDIINYRMAYFMRLKQLKYTPPTSSADPLPTSKIGQEIPLPPASPKRIQDADLQYVIAV